MLTHGQITSLVTRALGAAAVTARQDEGLHPFAVVPAEQLLAVAHFIRDNAESQLDMLRCISALDYPDKKQLVLAYDLLSYTHRHEWCLKVILPRPALPEIPSVPSVAGVWPAADWHEREAYDLMGINFLGHPDVVTDATGTHPRRILLPDDWQGFPLRKDYAFPREYEGIPGTVEMDWAQKSNYPK